MTQDKDRAAFEAQIELPPLPPIWGSAVNDAGDGHVNLITVGQAQDYARQAIAQDRQQHQTAAEEVCAEAYQVVGSLLEDLGIFNTERARKILDNLSQAKLVHDDVLPWPAVDRQQRGEALTRFCPECGHLGDVDSGFKDCCPDGSHARRVPTKFAELCSKLFQDAMARPAEQCGDLSLDDRDALRAEIVALKGTIADLQQPADPVAKAPFDVRIGAPKRPTQKDAIAALNFLYDHPRSDAYTEYTAVRRFVDQHPEDAPDMVEPVKVPSDDTIYLGCARMGLAGASDDEVLNYVRIAKRRNADATENPS